MFHGAEGTMEISRWRKPPVTDNPLVSAPAGAADKPWPISGYEHPPSHRSRTTRTRQAITITSTNRGIPPNAVRVERWALEVVGCAAAAPCSYFRGYGPNGSGSNV